MSYQVTCEWDGANHFFNSRKNAKAFKRAKKEEIHTRFCVDKKLAGDTCLCVLSRGERECSAHTYWRTMEPHTAKECIRTGEVYIDTVEVDD